MAVGAIDGCHFPVSSPKKLATDFYNYKEFVSNMNRISRPNGHYHQRDLLAVLLNQALFFMLCERWFCPEEHLTGVYSLLFYNVISYFVSYAKELIYLHKYSPYVRVSEHTKLRHLAMTATKVVIDLTKAVTFLITGVFLVLVFSLEQGLQHFNPTWLYVIITAFYFALTEKACQEKIPALLEWLEIDFFEDLGLLWAPILTAFFTSLLSGIMISLVWFLTHCGWMLIFCSAYINVYTSLKEMDRYWKVLIQERSYLKKYRYASRKELPSGEDDCPVCLQLMKSARVTPCKHYFHGECLRRCLEERMSCPLCKQQL